MKQKKEYRRLLDAFVIVAFLISTAAAQEKCSELDHINDVCWDNNEIAERDVPISYEMVKKRYKIYPQCIPILQECIKNKNKITRYCFFEWADCNDEHNEHILTNKKIKKLKMEILNYVTR